MFENRSSKITLKKNVKLTGLEYYESSRVAFK